MTPLTWVLYGYSGTTSHNQQGAWIRTKVFLRQYQQHMKSGEIRWSERQDSNLQLTNEKVKGLVYPIKENVVPNL